MTSTEIEKPADGNLESKSSDEGSPWFSDSSTRTIKAPDCVIDIMLPNMIETEEPLEACSNALEQKKLFEPLTLADLVQVLGSTIKRDNENKALTFLAMLLTYTDGDQINLGFLAEASVGKSYLPLEISRYFPEEDVKKLGYASPTAFFHEQGELRVDPEDKRELTDESERQRIKYIDLNKKILIFVDLPHDQLLQRLRSLLSHDERDIVVKITDRNGKGLSVKKIILHGFPTVVFCCAEFRMKDQEKTRLLLLSPESSQEKLRQSVLLKIQRESDREAFDKQLMEDPNRQLLKERVRLIKEAKISQIIIPEDLRLAISQRFFAKSEFLIARHQRDVGKLISIIKGHALLNFMHRNKSGSCITVAREDVDAGFDLYDSVSEANELGLSPDLFYVYARLQFWATKTSIDISGFQSRYRKAFHKRIGYETARSMLKTFVDVGLLTEFRDPLDKRVLEYRIFEPPEIKARTSSLDMFTGTNDESEGQQKPVDLGTKNDTPVVDCVPTDRPIAPERKAYICDFKGCSKPGTILMRDGKKYVRCSDHLDDLNC